MTTHLSNSRSSSMFDRDNILEMVCENGQVLLRGLSSTKNIAKMGHDYFSQSSKTRIQSRGDQTLTTNGSKNGIANITSVDPLSGLTKPKRLDDKSNICSLQTGFPELFSSELYEDGFNVVPDADKRCNDEKLVDSNVVVPVNQFESCKDSYMSKFVDPKQTVNSNSEVPDLCSLKQYEACNQSMRSKELKKSGVEEKSNKVNFSIFLRSFPAHVRSKHSTSTGATTRSTTKNPALAVGSEDLEGDRRSSPENNNNNNNSTLEREGARKMKDILLTNSEPQPQKQSHPDEQSEAAAGYHKDIRPNTSSRFPTRDHGGPSSSLAPKAVNPGNRISVVDQQMVASSSVCSRGDSNNPTYSLKRRSDPEETDPSTNHAMEEPKGTSTTEAAPVRGRKGSKRKRKAEVHNLSERKRRDKINKKMRALKELIPNCNKVDKASMLDDAIEYLKTLQLQVKMMMSMGNGVYMPPTPNFMMLPSAMQHLNAQGLGIFSPMGMRMCVPPVAQFPTSLLSSRSSAATLPAGITEAGGGFNMFGFPDAGQVSLMSMSPSPNLVSLAARFSPQSVQAPWAGVAAVATGQVVLPGAAVPQSTSKD